MKRTEKLDEIRIDELLIRAIVGLNPEEREKEQDIIINIVLYGDLTAACVSDNIEDTVDYKTIKQGVIKIVEQSKPLLVEHLAHLLAEHCLSFSKVQKVRIQVQKPSALRFAKNVGFVIERTK